MTAPRFGLFLSTRLAATLEHDDPAWFIAHAVAAEAARFDSIWVGDSLVARPRLEPLALLGALSAATRRATLGTAVLLPALRHPVTAAHALATLDRLTHGRLVVGVGTGFRYPGTARELALVGVPMAERAARVAETIAIWRRLWAARGPVSHAGRFWTLHDVELTPRPQQPGGPPIWMGGNGTGALRRAAVLADGIFPTSATPEVFRTAWHRVRELAADARRDPGLLTPAVVLTVHVDADRSRAHRELARYMEAYYGAALEQLTRFIGCRAGDAAACAEWIGRYVECGARHIVLRLASERQMEQLDRVASDVLPRLRGQA